MILRLTVPSTFDESQNQMIYRAVTRIVQIEGKNRKVTVELISEPTAAM